MGKDRYDKGIEALKKITGSSGEAVVEGLKDIAPDLADWIFIAAAIIIESQKEYPYFSQISIASRTESPLFTTRCHLKKSLTISFANFLSIGLCIFCTTLTKNS